MPRSALKNGVEAALAWIGMKVVDHVPLRLSLCFARGVGDLAYALLFRRRRLAVSNILLAKITDDPRRAREIARASFRHFATLSVEALVATRTLTEKTLDDHLELVLPPATRELLDNSSQGIIFVTPHLGNWEMTGTAFSYLKPLVAVARTMDNPYFRKLLAKRNPRRGMEIVEKHAADPMSLFRALRSGKGLALLIDQHAASHFVRVPFFGVPAQTVSSPARLHLATRCPIVCGCGIRTAPMKLRVVLSEPLRWTRTDDKEADAVRIMTELNHVLEDYIRSAPEQYLWSHRRWRT